MQACSEHAPVRIQSRNHGDAAARGRVHCSGCGLDGQELCKEAARLFLSRFVMHTGVFE